MIVVNIQGAGIAPRALLREWPSVPWGDGDRHAVRRIGGSAY
jgi:hypothetical protein